MTISHRMPPKSPFSASSTRIARPHSLSRSESLGKKKFKGLASLPAPRKVNQKFVPPASLQISPSFNKLRIGDAQQVDHSTLVSILNGTAALVILGLSGLPISMNPTGSMNPTNAEKSATILRRDEFPKILDWEYEIK